MNNTERAALNDRDREEIAVLVDASNSIGVAATDMELTAGRLRAQAEDLAVRIHTLTRQIAGRNSVALGADMQAVAASAADSRESDWASERFLGGPPIENPAR